MKIAFLRCFFRGGVLIHHDVRQREHIIMQTDAHYQEICGLKWSPDGKYLASGGNDNVLNIWQSLEGSRAPDQPLFTMNQHNAAVKAIAWCPWQPNVLASGGGTADRTIRLWNCNNGNLRIYIYCFLSQLIAEKIYFNL